MQGLSKHPSDSVRKSIETFFKSVTNHEEKAGDKVSFDVTKMLLSNLNNLSPLKPSKKARKLEGIFLEEYFGLLCSLIKKVDLDFVT